MSISPKKQNPLLKAITKPIPIHKENKRIWIETRKLNATSLGEHLTYHYTIIKNKKQIIIETADGLDDRKITKRKNGTPIIDICNADITELFKGIDNITIKISEQNIIIEPMKEELFQSISKDHLSDKELTIVDIFSGSGTLSASFGSEGFSSVCAVELEDKFLQNLEKNDSKTFTYNTSVTEMDVDLIPSATGILAGIPCENYSISGNRSEEEGETGALGYFLLQVVEKSRPGFCVIEQTSLFKKSALKTIIASVLKKRGYSISEAILDASDFGGISRRKRYCMVAVAGKVPFVFPEGGKKNTKTIGEILEVPIEDRVWLDKNNSRTIAYSIKKELAHIQKGDGFRLARTSVHDTTAATITKGYYKGRLTDPILVHPENPNRFSWFTPRELCRLNSLPEDFIIPEKKTPAGSLIGQGVNFSVFSAVAREIKRQLPLLAA